MRLWKHAPQVLQHVAQVLQRFQINGEGCPHLGADGMKVQGTVVLYGKGGHAGLFHSRFPFPFLFRVPRSLSFYFIYRFFFCCFRFFRLF